jgi:hypothetical protein
MSWNSLGLKPSKGLRVIVSAQREAIFEEEYVTVSKVSMLSDGGKAGILTGTTLAGYCEVEMPSLDGRKHWYPMEGLSGENGERIEEEEIQIDDEEKRDPEE